LALGRSRARRKEYLQELEAKLRSCEQIGIEASSQIQSAARKVLDENRKLRVLLHERGASEPDIVAALGGVSTAPRLNAMLERRITSNIMSTTSSPIPSHTRAASMPRHMPSVPPITIPQPRPTALSCNDSPSPGSMISSMSTPPPASYPASFYPTPMTPSTVEIKSEDVQYDYPYEQPFNSSWTYPNDYSYTADPAAYYSASSCIDAANIIRTMRSEVAPMLDVDLGCRAPDQQCYVNSATVYMMDKYSQGHTAI
jgi:hypothetical protein